MVVLRPFLSQHSGTRHGTNWLINLQPQQLILAEVNLFNAESSCLLTPQNLLTETHRQSNRKLEVGNRTSEPHTNLLFE